MVPNYTSFSLLSSSVHSASTSCPFLPGWWLYATAGPQLWSSSHVTATRGNFKSCSAIDSCCSQPRRHRDTKISVWKKGPSLWRWPWEHPHFLSLTTSHCQSLSAAEGLPESSASPCSCLTPMLHMVQLPIKVCWMGKWVPILLRGAPVNFGVKTQVDQPGRDPAQVAWVLNWRPGNI